MNIKTLNIQQSTNNIERIDHSVLHKMYDTYEAIMAENNGRGSTLRGKLSVDRAYSSWVEDLTRKWTSLKIDVDNGGYYQEWDDPEFKRCISTLWGDGTGCVDSHLSVSRTTKKNSSVESAFYDNKKIHTIDLRPFTNLLLEGTGNENQFYTVPQNSLDTEYNLREIYVSNVKEGTSFNLHSFIGAQSSTFTLNKVWFEGPNRIDDKLVEWNTASSSGQNMLGLKVQHFYWLNHSTGYGRNHHQQSTIDGETIDYINAYGATWQSRSVFIENYLFDTPIPIRIGGIDYWGHRPSKTTFWVPDDQLATWIKLYAQDGWQQVKDIKSIKDYVLQYPSLGKWWEYTGKTSNFIFDI
jgi:hypothetical protein